MDDALGVRLLQGLGDLLRDLEGFVDGYGAPRQALLEILALHQLEGEEGLPVGLLEPIDGGDVRVVEGGEEVSLALEAAQALRVVGHFGRQHLDRDLAPQRGVGRAVDLPHPARSEGGRDAVVRQGLSDQGNLRSGGSTRGPGPTRRVIIPSASEAVVSSTTR